MFMIARIISDPAGEEEVPSRIPPISCCFLDALFGTLGLRPTPKVKSVFPLQLMDKGKGLLRPHAPLRLQYQEKADLWRWEAQSLPQGGSFMRRLFRFLDPHGRMPRLKYFFSTITIPTLSLTAMILLSSFVPENGSALRDAAVGSLNSALFIAWGVALVLVTIQRLHDLDASGWYSVLIPIPIINSLLWFVLVFAKGSDGANRYGEA